MKPTKYTFNDDKYTSYLISTTFSQPCWPSSHTILRAKEGSQDFHILYAIIKDTSIRNKYNMY